MSCHFSPKSLLHAEALKELSGSVIWLGNATVPGRIEEGIPTGNETLDKALGGKGWPVAVLTELLWPDHGTSEFRLLAPALQTLMKQQRDILLLAPPYPVFAPGMLQTGLDVKRILVVHAEKYADCVWAAEQALKSGGFGALLCWLPQVRNEHLRRLQLAAAGSESLAFVLRPVRARHEPSPAPLRLACQIAETGRISVEIVKRRGARIDAPIYFSSPLPAAITGRVAALRSGTTNALARPSSSPVAAGSGVPSFA
jgi:hypothetical protein